MVHEKYLLVGIGTSVLFIYMISLILNSIGLYMVYKCVNRMPHNQRIYLMNFIVGEILMALAQMSYVIGHIVQSRSVQVYAALTQCTLAISWCLCMIFLTLDRFWEIKLNIQYHVYITNERVTGSIVFVWMLATVNASWMMLSKEFTDIDVLGIVLSAIFPIFEALFLLVNASVYIYIFRKVKMKKREAEKQLKTTRKQMTAHEQRIHEKKRKETRARNFVPFYIVITFLLFSLLPELIAAVFLKGLNWTGIKRTYAMFVATSLFGGGYIADALIYIFMYQQLRRMFLKKVRRNRIGTSSSMHHKTSVANALSTMQIEFKSVY